LLCSEFVFMLDCLFVSHKFKDETLLLVSDNWSIYEFQRLFVVSFKLLDWSPLKRFKYSNSQLPIKSLTS